MAILSVSEFEAVINQVAMRLEKILSARGSVPAIETAIRDLRRVFAAARQPGKLKPLRPVLDQVTELVGREIPDDTAVLEQLWDLADYVDYRA
jgi:hypothetical protein